MNLEPEGGHVMGRWGPMAAYLEVKQDKGGESGIDPAASIGDWNYKGFYAMATVACPDTDTVRSGVEALPEAFQSEIFLQAFLSFVPYTQLLPFYIFPEAAAYELARQLELDLGDPDPVSLYFGHDWGPIMPLLGLFEAELGDSPIDYWAPFASTLTIGVKFDQGADREEGTVEIDYLGQPLKTRHCDTPGDRFGKCRLSDFKQFLATVTQGAGRDDHVFLCNQETKSQAFAKHVEGRRRTQTWARKFADMSIEPIREFENWLAMNP